MKDLIETAVDVCMVYERELEKIDGDSCEAPSALVQEYDEFLRSPACSKIIRHWCTLWGVRFSSDCDSLDAETQTETLDAFYKIWKRTRNIFFVLHLVRGGSCDVGRVKEQLDEFEKYNSLCDEIDQHLAQAARLQGLPDEYYTNLEEDHLARQPKINVGELSIPTLDLPRKYQHPLTMDPRKVLGSCVGKIPTRGRAADPESATRALVTRRLSQIIPDSLAKRFSVIAELMNSSGFDTNAHKVRAVLPTDRKADFDRFLSLMPHPNGR